MKRWMMMLGMAVVVAAVAVPASAEDAKTVGDPYALDVCPVSGEKLGSMGDPVVISHEGREIKFCCSGCEPKFNADPAKFISKIDEMMIAQQEESYPLENCPVSGKPASVTKVINNRMMKFCCNNCPSAAAKDPDKFIAKLDEAAIEKQMDSYAAKTCPISGKELGSMGDPVNMVVANKLVRLCCAGCEKPVNAEPAKALSKVSGD